MVSKKNFDKKKTVQGKYCSAHYYYIVVFISTLLAHREFEIPEKLRGEIKIRLQKTKNVKISEFLQLCSTTGLVYDLLHTIGRD